MNEQSQQKTFSPDDPKLTAYALGELSGAEHAEMEAWVGSDPAARAAVDEIRALAAQLEGALASEALNEPVSATGELATATAAAGLRRVDDPYRKKVVRFPYVWIGTLAAACVAVMITLNDREANRAAQRNALAQSEAAKSVASGADENAANVSGGTTVAQTVDGQLSGKPAGSFSVDGPVPAATRGRAPVFLVADEKEAAQLPVPEKTAAVATATEPVIDAAVVATTADTRVDAASDGIFMVDTTPLKAEVAYAGNSAAPGATLISPEPTVAKSEPSETRQAAEAPAAVPAVAPQAGAPTILAQTGGSGKGLGSGDDGAETLQLNAFVVEASRFGYAGAMAGSRTNARNVVSTDAFDGVPGAQAGTAAAYLTGNDARFPRMNFRAKSTAPARPDFNTEAYAFIAENDFARVRQAPLSTFSADVDTASYANVRRFLDRGQRPPRDAVRVEEMVNYFNYRYTPPTKEVKEPFAASMEIASAPWNPAHRLVRIGVKGREIAGDERPAANLVFLLDVSGSMSEPNKLPLVKESLRLLVDRLRAEDRVAIVTYAGASGLALASTPASKKREIAAALEELRPDGGTNGAMGIQLAYDIAKANFIAGGANRVILCTDGDFNVGVTNDGDLTRLIEEKAKSGVFLTVLGFGMGNYKDSLLERLADKGNGNYGYIDSRAEAEKLLVEQAGGTLVTIAKDVKLQVEFNPAVAQAYRLIGYENRVLDARDFNNDQVDAGEIGAGHSVTALYEIVPVGAPAPETAPEIDPLKYQTNDVAAADEDADEPDVLARRRPAFSKEELLTLKIRFKEPTVDISQKMEIPVIDTGAAFEAASKDFKFAAAVASLGMMLRESAHAGKSDYDRIISWAEAGRGDDADGRRGEFIELVKKARTLSAE